MVNQKEVINRIAEKTGLRKQDIKKMIIAFREVVYDVISEEKSLFIKELFHIKPVEIKGRNRYIAPYHKAIYQDKHKSVKIIPSKKLIEEVKNNE
jgi:nucleoid DNA-binding protein